MRTIAHAAGLLALGTLLAGAAAATDAWRVERATSALSFTATQAGARFEGRFERFDAAIRFDPGALGGARFEVSIDTASAATGESERDGMLKGPDFFDVGRHPAARYVAGAFRRTSDGFAADGELTLRGVTRPVSVDFRFEPADPGRARLTGSATLRRLDFGVGRGEWAGTEWLGDEVEVRFELALVR